MYPAHQPAATNVPEENILLTVKSCNN